MKTLRFILISLICTLLLSSCTLKPGGNDDKKGSLKIADGYETVSVSDAKSDFIVSGDKMQDYYIKAAVSSLDDASAGKLTVTEDNVSLKIESLVAVGEDGEAVKFNDMAEKPEKDSVITVKVNLELVEGEIVAWFGVLIEVETDDDNGNEAPNLPLGTIAAARELEEGADVRVAGTVVRVTYAFGMKPTGFILADETSSIYVYDSAAAKSVKEGNRVELIGQRAYWILEEEQTHAAKFGYKGSSQIEKVTILSNDKKTDSEFDKSWIQQISVKELVDTPVTEDVTSKIYKLTALVKEVPGSGFTNFYFYDLDGKTGAYTYTQCNGDDFLWLREFEGKFCTVYITALNAKSTSSDCYFRFLPVAVYDEGFSFEHSDAPEYAVKYHGLTQLKESYSGDPALTLYTSVSSELLGFDGVTLSFSSSDESVIKFTETADGVIMNCPGFGTATVTVTARLGDFNYSDTTKITVTENTDVGYIGVGDAIEAEAGETVTVKGIVGPSFVHANRRGFYLIDQSGTIAVSFASADDLIDIAIGNEVIVTGKRDTIKSAQICIDEAALVSNYYGTSSLPENAIDGTKSLAEIKNLTDTTKIFSVTASAEFIVGGYSKTYNLVCEVNGTKESYQLYSSNAETQYSFLADVTEDTTVLVTLCNWNGKGYKLCAVGAVIDGNTVYNEYSFSAAKK